MRDDILPWAARGFGFALGVALLAVLGILFVTAGGVVLLLFAAILLASALEPFVGWIRTHLPIGRGPTILVVYAAFILVVVAMALIVVPAAVGEGQRIIARLPRVFDETRTWAATVRPEPLGRAITALVNSAAERITPPSTGNADAVVRLGLTVAESAVSLVTVLTLVFFWLVEHARLQRYGLAFLPMDRRAGARDAWNEIENRLGMWVRGQLTLMTAMGLATGAVYSALGVPAAVLLALIAALTEAIPIVGPLLGAIPAVLVASSVSPQLALIVALAYIVLQLIEGTVLVPVVMRNTVGISPLLVLVSLLVGAAVGGFVGALFAVPIAASLEIVLSRLQARRVPVAQDPAAIETPDDEERTILTRSLPDAPSEASAQ